MEFKANNVNDHFKDLVYGIHAQQIPTIAVPSRAGNVLMVDEPVTVTYLKPWERVLFNPLRDANPFFHMFESLWMLAGRNDVEPLSYYSSGIADIASDDGETFNGAYGYRWKRSHGGMTTDTHGYAKRKRVNQLDELIDHLLNNPNSRRAVLQMWNVESDLLRVESTKDVCCNTAVYFSLKKVSDYETSTNGTLLDGNYELNMTVTNRSNDLIWGMLGANAVHFSFLQEYMANRLGASIGKYVQFTNNLHVYENNWKPEFWLSAYAGRTAFSPTINYGDNVRNHVKLVQTSEFDKEVSQFVDENYGQGTEHTWKEPFLETVAKPMCDAFSAHKKRKYNDAVAHCENIRADDWRIACSGWILSRYNNWRIKNAK